jgi:hypothetical protein
MKKIKIVFLFVIASAGTATAQKGGYSKADKLLNIGVGVNSYYTGGIPLGVSFEAGITDQISIGANVDYLSHKYQSGSTLSYKFTALYFGVRASYHVNELLNIAQEKVDLYGGLTLGYRSFGWKDNYSSSTLSGSYGSGIYFGGYVGGKYYFGNNIGAFAELGAIGSTNARVGLDLKF